MRSYDIAAYIWPAYTGDEPRTRMFWPEGMGEWQTVRDMKPLYPGHAWPRRPRWGYVNEADPFVMEMEIEAAASHGVNVFIYDWYWFDNRPFLEQCLNDGYLKARNNDKVKFFLMWANHTATSMWDKRIADMHVPIWSGEVDRPVFETIVNRAIDRYFCQPSYYKIDGKPVYMLFDLINLIRGLGGVEETRKAIAWFRDRMIQAGYPGLHLLSAIRNREYMAQVIDPEKGTTLLDFINGIGFDGLTHYQFFDFAPMNRPYPEILEDVKKEWAFVDETMKAPYHPQVSLGWDSNPRYNIFHDEVCTENTPENIEKAMVLAKEYVDSHALPAPLITVNSWNEWTEGSYLHPDDLYGYGYLEAIRRVFLDGKESNQDG